MSAGEDGDGAEPSAIGDYGLIGDCHSAALVSRWGSIDWCCLPRFDAGSCFGRLLDSERGGHCAVTVDGGADAHATSSYLGDTMVLETRIRGRSGVVRLIDFFAMREGGARNPRHELIRIVECERDAAQVSIEIAPRFDYGDVRPWLRRMREDQFSAIGGDDGLLVWSDGELSDDDYRLRATRSLRAGERLRLVLRFVRPHLLEEVHEAGLDPDAVDARLDQTVAWWERWCRRVNVPVRRQAAVLRSCLTLKALTYAPTGAIIAAPTTSLPEVPGGERNWDYRYSWIRDSVLASHALAEVGCEREARSFRHFIVRSSAGHAEDLQILFGAGGERRLTEAELGLAGYGGARPVRIGNRAARQLQLDALGEVLNLGWRWHRRGHSPTDDEWRFFRELVEVAVERWSEPDHGIWEWPDKPRHFVHSKASCWVAVERGLQLASECERRAPVRRWRKARSEIRDAIESHGFDPRRGTYLQCFDRPELDAALLLLPVMGYTSFDDERMVSTTEAVAAELDADGLLRRYKTDDGLRGQEGAFLACSFWLAECRARQGRLLDARAAFDRAMGAAGDLGLLPEEFDPATGERLGNYPQALTHLSHIAAAVALAAVGGEVTSDQAE